jgi:HD superfamily phosphodiesterase
MRDRLLIAKTMRIYKLIMKKTHVMKILAGTAAAATIAFLVSASVTRPTRRAASDGDWRGRVTSLAADKFKHPAWGYSHSKRDYALARQLAATDGVALDDDVLFASAYLHDIGTFAPWESTVMDHADAGAASVPRVLTDMGFPASKIPTVQDAIRTHMYDRTPVGPEARYLHDADALDWLGAIGAARVLALVDEKGGDPSGPDVVKQLQENLTDVPGKLVSPAGKALVAERLQQLDQFLKMLASQTNNIESL